MDKLEARKLPLCAWPDKQFGPAPIRGLKAERPWQNSAFATRQRVFRYEQCSSEWLVGVGFGFEERAAVCCEPSHSFEERRGGLEATRSAKIGSGNGDDAHGVAEQQKSGIMRQSSWRFCRLCHKPFSRVL